MTDVDAPANVLLLAPAHTDGEDAACAELLTPTAPARENVLSITLTQSPDDRLAVWREHVGEALPANAGFVDVGEQTRSADASAVAGCRTEAADVFVDVVSSPRDLTSLGVAVTNALSRWSENGNRTVVCLHSITALLQYGELRQVFQFLHLLTRAVDDANAIAHYHLDPTAHDGQTVNTIRMLFDEVIEPDDEGSGSRDRSPSRRGGADAPDRANAVEHRTRIADDESPYRAVVRAIVDVEGEAPVDRSDPLYDWIDPEALDAVLAPSASSGVGDVRVEFTWGSYRVLVDRGTVTVRRTDGA